LPPIWAEIGRKLAAVMDLVEEEKPGDVARRPLESNTAGGA
jgi:hypothetical protein